MFCNKLLVIFFLNIVIIGNYSLCATNYKPNTIVILLHLYDISLMDEIIQKINNFISLNHQENYYIKINIPIAKNIEQCKQFDDKIEKYLTIKKEIYNWCINKTPYHSYLITQNNCLKLYCIATYLKEKLFVQSTKLQIIFSENRGVDIGGFLLLIDQVIKQKLQYDYIVKLHTKKNKNWRNKLLAILDLNLRKYLPHFNCIYPCKWLSDKKMSGERVPRLLMKKILKIFGGQEIRKFYFAAGSMFIASYQIGDFFKKFNRIALFNQLKFGYYKSNEFEHAFERFFGYLTRLLGLRVYYCNILNKEDLNSAYSKHL